MELTQARARDLFAYNPTTGIVTWKVSSPRRRAGSIAGSVHSDVNGVHKCVRVGADKKMYELHRVIWLMVYGKWPNKILHVNRDPTDGRLVNLKNATWREIVQAQKPGARFNGVRQSISKFVGVLKIGKKWRAQISVGGKNKHLGYFNSADDAIAARKQAEIKYDGTAKQ